MQLSPVSLALQLPGVTLPLQQLAVTLFDGQLQNVGKPFVDTTNWFHASCSMCLEQQQVLAS
jgi:hypothetical protein